jgi:hypothetical protein
MSAPQVPSVPPPAAPAPPASKSEVYGSGHGSVHQCKSGDAPKRDAPNDQKLVLVGIRGASKQTQYIADPTAVGGYKTIHVPHVEKQTHYRCAQCNAVFHHFYSLQPDIFKAMKAANVPSTCL